MSPSSSTSCPLPCGILAPGCCKQAADPGLFFLSFLTATGLCLFQHSCVPLSPLVAGNNSMHTQVHQRKLPLTALQGHDGVCESYAPSFNHKVSNFSTRSVHFGYSDCTSTQKSTPAIVTLKSYILLILPTKIVLLVKNECI